MMKMKGREVSKVRIKGSVGINGKYAFVIFVESDKHICDLSRKYGLNFRG